MTAPVSGITAVPVTVGDCDGLVGVSVGVLVAVAVAVGVAVGVFVGVAMAVQDDVIDQIQRWRDDLQMDEILVRAYAAGTRRDDALHSMELFAPEAAPQLGPRLLSLPRDA